MTDVTPRPKAPPRKKAKKGGRARPDEPLALVCEAKGVICCLRPATERHHKLRRSHGGTDDAANTMDLCSDCHAWIHANPARSYELGYLIRGVR